MVEQRLPNDRPALLGRVLPPGGCERVHLEGGHADGQGLPGDVRPGDGPGLGGVPLAFEVVQFVDECIVHGDANGAHGARCTLHAHKGGSDVRVTLETEVDETTLARLRGLDIPTSEGLRRAVALYDVLDNPDEVLREMDELGGGGGE